MAKAQSNWRNRSRAFWLSIVAFSRCCEELELLDRINRIYKGIRRQLALRAAILRYRLALWAFAAVGLSKSSPTPSNDYC
jgi:hypothetical protein